MFQVIRVLDATLAGDCTAAVKKVNIPGSGAQSAT
jgi:hypothetical protein